MTGYRASLEGSQLGVEAISPYLYPLETNLLGNNLDTPMVIPADWC